MRYYVCVFFLLLFSIGVPVFSATEIDSEIQFEMSEINRDPEATAAKMVAEHDADHKTNDVLMFTAGLATSAACVFGAYIGAQLAYLITDSTLDYDYADYQPPAAHTCLGVPVASVTPIRFLGSLSGATACGGLSFLGIYYAKPSKPPSERFIGKSPEYVKAYMAVYTSKARSNRIKSAAAGTATGCLGFIVLFIEAYY